MARNKSHSIEIQNFVHTVLNSGFKEYLTLSNFPSDITDLFFQEILKNQDMKKDYDDLLGKVGRSLNQRIASEIKRQWNLESIKPYNKATLGNLIKTYTSFRK